MSMRKHIRRLSLVLGGNKPSDGLPISTTLLQFLASSKEQYLSDVRASPPKGGDWTVVMGNEAGDLDSIASAIAYAWIESEVHKRPTIPLMQMQSNDFSLRPENLYALSLAGISSPASQLLTLSDLSFMTVFPSNKFALVDHNRLGITYAHTPGAEVTALIDHHEDEKLYQTASPRIISPCGSCASHLALLCSPETPLPPELATLLLSAIFIDTSGLEPGGKGTSVDVQATAFLGPRSTFAASIPTKLVDDLKEDPAAQWEKTAREFYKTDAIKTLTKALEAKKDDVEHLTGIDLLRRDYKEYTYLLDWAGDKNIKAGLSSIPLSLETVDRDGKLGDAIISWMETREIQILGVLTSYRNAKGKHKREMAWVVYGGPVRPKEEKSNSDPGVDFGEVARRLWKGLEDSKELDASKHKKVALEREKLPNAAKAKVYKVGNSRASRKLMAPLLKSIMVDSEASEKEEKKRKRMSFLARA